MVQISVSRRRELQGSEADVVKGLVVDDVRFVGIFDQLMDRERGVVRLDDDVGYFRRWNDRKRIHDSVGVFFSDFGNEKGAHSRPGTSAE